MQSCGLRLLQQTVRIIQATQQVQVMSCVDQHVPIVSSWKASALCIIAEYPEDPQLGPLPAQQTKSQSRSLRVALEVTEMHSPCRPGLRLAFRTAECSRWTDNDCQRASTSHTRRRLTEQQQAQSQEGKVSTESLNDEDALAYIVLGGAACGNVQQLLKNSMVRESQETCKL